MKTHKRKWKAPDVIHITTTDLRAFLFWAAFGVENAVSGSYSENIAELIHSYAKYLHMSLPRPRFGKLLRGKLAKDGGPAKRRTNTLPSRPR